MSSGNIRIAKNTVYLYIRLLVVMFISLFSVRIIMQELGEQGYGTFNVVAGFVTMVGFIGTTMTPGIQRFFNYEMGQRGEFAASDVLSAAIKIQIVASLIVLILFETIGLWYLNNIMNLPQELRTEINLLFQFAIFSLILNILVVPYNAFVIAKEHMNCYAIISIVESLAKLGIAYAIGFFTSNRLAIYGLFLLGISILNFLSYYIYSRKLFPWFTFKWQAQKNLIMPILSFSGWNTLSSATNIGKGQGVNLLLNYFFGVSINAANAIVTQVYSAVQVFSLNICTAFRPQIVESYAKCDFNKTISMFYTMSKCACAMVIIILIPLILQLPFVLHLWLGNIIPEYTTEFINITLMIIAVGSLNTPITIVIFANGNIKWYTLLYASILLCIPIGWLAFENGASVTSIFWITLILTGIIQCASLLMLKRYLAYSIKVYLRTVIIPLIVFSILASLLPLSISRCNINHEVIKFLCVCSSSLLSSAFCVYYILLSKTQRNFLILTIKKYFNR